MSVMNSQNHNDLVPRPSPKPSQIEVPVMSSGPEVPEASLLFDSNVRRAEPVGMLTASNSINKLKTTENAPIPTRSQVYNNDHRLINEQERTNCYCGVIPESYDLISQASSTSPRLCPRTNLCRDNQSSVCAVKQYSHYTPHPTTHNVENCNDLPNSNETFITLGEYQKMVAQFTKLIFNLNFKYNDILNNSISREELNQITRKFELQIENLTQRVEELNLKLEKANKKLVSPSTVGPKCCQSGNEPVFYPVRESRCCQVEVRPSCNFEKEPQVLVSEQSPKQRCPRLSSQQLLNYEYKNHRCVMSEEDSDHVSRNRARNVQDAPVYGSSNSKCDMSTFDLTQQNDTQNQCFPSPKPKLPSKNLIAPTDLNILMNTLAVKNIPMEQYDPKKQDWRQECDVMIHNSRDCNNISMATLQYMERYQLLSSRNDNPMKSHGVKETKSPLSNQQLDYQDAVIGNDRSFVR